MRQALPFALGLMISFLAAGTPVDAENAQDAVQPLELVLKARGPAPPRFTLDDGQTVIGHVVQISASTITIRRPSGGLRSLLLADLRRLDIKNADGELVRGRITLLADGRYGWAKTAASAGKEPDIARSAADAAGPDVGGPLVKLAIGDRSDQGPAEGASIDSVPRADAGEATPDEVTAKAEETTHSEPPLTNADPNSPSKPRRLDVTASTVSETDKLIYFHLKLSEPAEHSIVIIYTMLNGTATSPLDYTHRQGVVVFDPGQTQAAIATPIIDDETAESRETFHLFVTGDPNSVIIEDRTVVATILDDDA